MLDSPLPAVNGSYSVRSMVRSAGVLLVVALLLLAGPGARRVDAHAQLVSTVPRQGERLDTSPDRVTITFDERVHATRVGITVLDANARRVESGPTRGDGKTMSVGLTNLPPGAYVVVWRAVSADGHPVRGSFTFQVGDGNQAGLAVLGERQLTGSVSDPLVLRLMQSLRFVLFACAALVIASLVWRWRMISTPIISSTVINTPMILTTAGWVALVAAAGIVLVDGPYGDGRGLGSVGIDLVGESLGKLTVRAILAAGLITLLGARLCTRSDAPSVGLVVTPIAIGLSLASSGHAVAATSPVFAIVATAAHVIAASVWTAGLVLLTVHLVAERQLDLARWSGTARAAVLVLALTGAANGFRQVGSLDALRTTTFGRLLMAKLALVAVMMALGAFHNRASHNESTHPLGWRSVAAETGLGIIVLGLSIGLASTVPARVAVSRPVTIRIATATTRSDITVDPAKRGANEVHLYVFGTSGTTRDITDANFVFTHLATGTTVEVDPFKAGRGHEQARVVNLPFAGTWQIETRIYLSDFDVETATSTFTLR